MKFKNINDEYLKKLIDSSIRLSDDNLNPLSAVMPIAKNGMTSKALYYNRLNYEVQFHDENQKKSIDSQTFRDYLYEDQLYGKINLNNEILNVNEQFLKNLDSNVKMMLLAPAADSFNEMFIEHRNITNREGFAKNSKFIDIIPKKAFISPNIQHGEYINQYFDKFYSFINQNNLNDKILNFKLFIKYFINFYNQNDTYIINKTEFMRTSVCNPLTTGLVVEIASDKHGNDQTAYKNYVMDNSYELFNNLTKSYGFVIDKHSPWRLTFDISSFAAQRYLEKYNTNNLQDYFNTFYYYTEYFNYQTLKINLLNFYNFIVSQKETVRNVRTSFKNNKICISEKLINRPIIFEQQFNQHFLEDDMLKVYFYTKAKENNIIFSKNVFEQQYNEVLTIKNYNNLISAFDFIDTLCKKNYNVGNSNYKIELLID